jgi:hypothetical protein
MKKLFWLSCFLFLQLMISCRTPNDVSKGKAIYTDVKPEADETWTKARLRPLNRYASDLMSEYEVRRDEKGSVIETTGRKEPLQAEAERSFRNLGIDPASVLPLGKSGEKGERGNYLLFIAEDSDHCFFEGTFDQDIYWNTHRDQVKQQIEYVARFLKDFHVAIGGDTKQAFVPTEIEICSARKLGSEMRWQPGGKLEIGIPYSIVSGGNYLPLTPAQLMAKWTSGEMFYGTDSISTNLKKVWPIVNPMSSLRKALVKKLKGWSSALIGKIDSVNKSSVGALGGLVRSNVDKTMLDYDPLLVLEKIENASQTDSFLQHWRDFVANRENHEGLIAANMAAASEKIKVKNQADGWLVSVANYHRIAVEGSIASGKFTKYLKVDEPRTVDIDLKCTGMIAVCTIDDITVLLQFIQNNIHYDLSLETAGFNHAVERSIGKPKS